MALAGIEKVARNEAGIETVLGILRQRYGERLQTGQAIRDQHGHTMTYIPGQAPDGVLFAEAAEEVQEAVRVCGEHGVPVIPFGTGSSLEGHVNAPGGGISIDLSKMNRVLAVHAEDLDCTVGAGDADTAQHLSARHRPVLADRSRRGCQPRRHGVDAGLRHKRSALRHDARQCDVGDRRHG